MKKKIYSRVIAVIIAITAVTMVSAVGKNIASAAENRQYFIPKSYGRFIYDDSDTSNNNGHEHDLLIDGSDFAVIAENINSLNDITNGFDETVVRKDDVIDTIEEIKQNTEENKVVGANVVKELIQAFQDGVNKIYDKLAGLGFTPKTNSPDDINEAIQDMYDSRYREGYTDGIAQMQTNAKITYTYHQHTGNSTNGGGCYTDSKLVTVYIRCDGQKKEGDPYFNRTVLIDSLVDGRSNGTCTVCGRGGGTNGGAAVGSSIRCDYAGEEYITKYSLGCGMSTNTIISAVISFDSDD